MIRAYILSVWLSLAITNAPVPEKQVTSDDPHKDSSEKISEMIALVAKKLLPYERLTSLQDTIRNLDTLTLFCSDSGDFSVVIFEDKNKKKLEFLACDFTQILLDGLYLISRKDLCGHTGRKFVLEGVYTKYGDISRLKMLTDIKIYLVPKIKNSYYRGSRYIGALF